MSYKYSVYNSAKQRPRSGRSASIGRKKRGEYIDPTRYVRTATQSEVAAYTATHKFSDFDLVDQIQTNLAGNGFLIPSPIQDQTIPLGLAGQDVIGIASTGTGKTAAFAVPILQALLTRQQSSALIVAPTRELAQQIEQACRVIARNTPLRSVLLIGGSNMSVQLRNLRSRPRLVIGTPGRIKDHIERGNLRLEFFNIVTLDEVDRMLDMGFLPDMTFILKHLAPQRQSFFFSATMDSRVEALIKTFSADAKTVSIKSSESSDNVHQDVIRYGGNQDKMAKLQTILSDEAVAKVIIFDETQRNVERLNTELLARGFVSDAIHGGKSQGQRKRALDGFKSNKSKILVATDVAARGIDVADITHVINYTQPQSYQDYIHRIGRAGRAGRIGYALTFVES